MENRSQAKTSRRRWPKQYFAAFSASLSEIVIGFVYGWVGPALLVLKGESSEQLSFTISSDEAGWVVSLVDVGSMVIAIPAGIAASQWGRRRVLLFSAVFFLVSWILILEANSVGWVYAGRVLAGAGGGTVFAVNTMYWGEISSAEFRGSASSLTQAGLFLGVLLAGLLAPFVSYFAQGVCGIAVTLLFVVCFFPMPESPYYHLMRQREDLAHRALCDLRGTDDVEDELSRLRDAVEADMADGGSDTRCVLGCADLVATRGTVRALFIAVVLGMLQRLAGLSAIIGYTSGTLPPSLREWGSVLLGTALFLASFGPLFLMDRLGRRPLLIGSSVALCVSMLASGAYYFRLNSGLDVDSLGWLPLSGLGLYALAYSLGMGPVPDIVPGEVFPTNIKGLAVSLVNVSLTGFTFLTSKVYQVVEDGAGVEYMYFSFALVAASTALFAAFLMPETRGKTLEEIRTEMEDAPWLYSGPGPQRALAPLPRPRPGSAEEGAVVQRLTPADNHAASDQKSQIR